MKAPGTHLLAAWVAASALLVAQVPNDECTQAIAIGEGITSGTNTGATTSSQASTCAGLGFPNQPANDVWFLYTASCAGVTRISLAAVDGGSATGFASLAIYTGTCPSNLTKIACAGQIWFQPRITIPITAGTQLYVAVGSVTGAGGPFNLSIQCFAPVANDECATATQVSEGTFSGTNVNATTSTGFQIPVCLPLPANIGDDVWFRYLPSATGTALISTCPCDGGSATFNTVVATFGGACATGMTSIGCAIGGLFGSQARMYVPVVSGVPLSILVGGSNSAFGTFNLVIAGYPTVVNDDCATALPLGNGVTAGHIFGATPSPQPGPCAATVRDVWYVYTPACSGVATFSLCPADGGSCSFYPVLAAYAGSCPFNLTFLSCNSTGCSPYTAYGTKIAVPVTQGVPIRIVVGTTTSGQGPFQLAASCAPAPPNDSCAGALPVSWGANGPYDNTTASDGYLPTSCIGADGGDLWYSWSSTVTGNVHVETCGATFAAHVHVFDACGGAQVGCASFNGSVCPGGSFLDFPAVAGHSYRIRVAGLPPNSHGAFHLRISGPYALVVSSPGPGKLNVATHSGTPFAAYFTGATLTAGAFPNGWFFGIDPVALELYSEFAYGFPHAGVLDAAGSSPPLTITGGVPPGLTIHAVSATYDPVTWADVDVSAPVLFVTQ